jgi:aryl-alcohol dehydrogenase-like predicted oxidoreductase
MDYNKLPGTQIKVSKICLGTMTWGRQNNEHEGHEQMDFAFDQGVNFFDTAELYPIPPRQEEQGETERIIGSWFKKSGHREKIILASKIAGPAAFTQHIRTDKSYSKKTIDTAVEKSLKRLQTDYIDLYQLHWPERPTNFFGKRGYDYERGDVWEENFEMVLEA